MENRIQNPALSLVLPCYNEERCLEQTVPPLAKAFQEAEVAVELVLVDNGSTDRTSEVIDRLITRGLPVTKGVVPANQGLGLGVLTGFGLCRGRYIGYICADGQVAPEDVVRVYRALSNATIPSLAKARRRFRQDSWVRKVVSIGYNILMHLLFPGIPCLDVNGNPKIAPADLLSTMELTSTDWFLDAEIMLKARHLKVPVVEINVAGRPREGGHSHVRLATVSEFVRNIVAYRAGGQWSAWRTRMTPARRLPEALTTQPKLHVTTPHARHLDVKSEEGVVGAPGNAKD